MEQGWVADEGGRPSGRGSGMKEDQDSEKLLKKLIDGIDPRGPGYRVFMGEPEVVEEEKRVIRPDIMQFLMQAASLSQAVRLRKLEESKVPTGETNLTLPVTDEWAKLELERHWISFSLINDGPGDIFLRVNFGKSTLSPDAPIHSSETYNVDTNLPIIERLYYRSAPGTIAGIRIFAEEGQWA